MTMPSAVFLMASAGQTSAQVGDSQCMQTTGMVCTECARSAVSRWIIDLPLCVSHSLHAWTHDWQPMHRLWSRYIVRFSATGMGVLSGRAAGFIPAVFREDGGDKPRRSLTLVFEFA